MSHGSFVGETRPFRSIREKILADIEKYDRRFDELMPCSPLPYDYEHMRASVPVPSIVVNPCEAMPYHRHQQHHCNQEHFYCPGHCFDANRLTSPKTPCSSTSTAVTANKSDHKAHSKSPMEEAPTNLIRSKSCPKDLFSSTNDVTEDKSPQSKPIKSCIRRLVRSNASPECSSHTTVPCRKKSATRKKMPDAIDEFLTSKMVRSNLAANLRQQWARKKITEMTDKRLSPPPPAQVTTHIPKCHRWNVRDTPAWKSFRLEE